MRDRCLVICWGKFLLKLVFEMVLISKGDVFGFNLIPTNESCFHMIFLINLLIKLTTENNFLKSPRNVLIPMSSFTNLSHSSNDRMRSQH